jgi:predicted AAA+ superfamily ATPase
LELLRDDLKKKWGDAKNLLSFNLEDTDQLTALNRDPKYFREYLSFSGADPKKESVVMIDEVQYLNDPSHFLKYMADFESSLKLIVTGSTSLAIKRFKDGMTGRKKTFTLFSVDFKEFLLFKGNKRLLSVLEEFHYPYHLPVSYQYPKRVDQDAKDLFSGYRPEEFCLKKF